MYGAYMDAPGRRRARDIGASPLGVELLEDAEGLSLALRVAVRAQLAQLLFEQLQFTYAQGDMFDVLVEHRVHLAAVRRGPVQVAQQDAHLVEAPPGRPCTAPTCLPGRPRAWDIGASLQGEPLPANGLLTLHLLQAL